MSEDVPPNRNLLIAEHHAIRVGHNLIGDDNRHPELLGYLVELSKELPQMHLSVAEFPASGVLRSEVVRRRIVD